MILVAAEQRQGTLHRASWETLAAAQELAAGGAVDGLIIGRGSERAAAELSHGNVGTVHVIDHAALESYTPDGYVAALEQAVAALGPEQVFLPHTYQTRDFAPKLAARLDRPLITDCVRVTQADGRASFYRPVFQGKLIAQVAPEGSFPHFVSIQIGAYRADAAKRRGAAAPIKPLTVQIDSGAVRERPEAP